MMGRRVADPLPLDRELKAAVQKLLPWDYSYVADPLPLDRELKADGYWLLVQYIVRLQTHSR